MDSIASFTIEQSTINCRGDWTAANLGQVEQGFGKANWPTQDIRFDLSQLDALDTSGAWLLRKTISKLEASGRRAAVIGATPPVAQLLELVEANSQAAGDPPQAYLPGFLESVGRHVETQLKEYSAGLNFVGRLAYSLAGLILRPWKIRGARVIKELQSAGVDALPIVGLLSFLIGIVIAYQGAFVLQDYGASIYMVDIVGLSMVRELAPLIAAIIVAGRTGSAYAAQIGTMMVTEEVDALRSIGIAPMEILVVPKLIALVIALPLLTVFADVMGLLGGMVMANSLLDINAATYLRQLESALSLQSYLSGIGKSPVFAIIIATVGCFQGFQVFGGAENVGRRTTISVVQAIFLVIIVDAVFSIVFSKLGI